MIGAEHSMPVATMKSTIRSPQTRHHEVTPRHGTGESRCGIGRGTGADRDFCTEPAPEARRPSGRRAKLDL